MSKTSDESLLASGIVNDKVIIAQFPVSNNIAELPGLGHGHYYIITAWQTLLFVYFE